MRDFRWQSNGGLLIDGSGDIACTDPGSMESIQDIVRSRLKAAVDGWKLYRIGAGLNERLGSTVGPETEIALRRQVTQCLTNSFLPAGSFKVETLSDTDRIHVFVYVNQQLIGKAVVNKGS